MRGGSWFQLTAVLLIGLWLHGCVGQRRESRKQTIQVTTDPAGAEIWIQDPTGKRILGTSPREVDQKYEAEVSEFNRWLWASVPVSLLAGGFGGAFIWASLKDTGSLGSEDTPMFASGIALIALGAAGLVLGLVYGVKGEQQQGQVDPITEKIVLGANLPGYQTRSEYLEIPSPGAEKIELKLVPNVSAGPRRDANRERHIVAVFDLQDASKTLDPETVAQLTSYLGTVLAQFGDYSVVPRDQLRQRLRQEKVGSYGACYDESCQIELGKAVAAQKSLATTLMKVGEKCPITANLIDLKTETVERAASAEPGCSKEQLLGAMKSIAQQLAKP